MIKVKLSNGAFILGLDKTNVEKLKEGKPLLVSLSQIGGVDDVCIMYGDTLDDIKNELESISGEPLHPSETPIPH